jgi:SAM-dependent methyltransferase
MSEPETVDRPDPAASEPTEWEKAYLRFETPEQEVRKFESRLQRLGARQWPPGSEVVELFCGRGNGLRALHRLGFSHVEGIDLSAALASRYEGPGRVLVGDCRSLPFESGSRDVLIVQGGLHHLPVLPDDLDRTLAEAARVLRPGGRFVAVEPWLTPFLTLAHAACGVRLLRAVLPKVDDLATMIEYERVTYEQWLGSPEVVSALLHRHFEVETEAKAFGKLSFVGRRRKAEI